MFFWFALGRHGLAGSFGSRNRHDEGVQRLRSSPSPPGEGDPQPSTIRVMPGSARSRTLRRTYFEASWEGPEKGPELGARIGDT